MASTPVESIYTGDCRTIRALVDRADAVNPKLQQAYMPPSVSLKHPEPDDHLYKLGPYFCSKVEGLIEELSEVYPSTSFQPLVSDCTQLTSWGTWYKDTNPTKGWHRSDQEFNEWIFRLSAKLGSKWKRLRIYEAIFLSTCTIPFDYSLMSALMCFWNKSCKAFQLPEGMLSLTMEDTVAISHLLESKYPRSKPTLLALKKKDLCVAWSDRIQQIFKTGEKA